MSQSATVTGGYTPLPTTATQAGLDVLRAEWTKVRTVPETGWLVAATAVLTVAVSTAVIAVTRCTPGTSCPADTTKLSLTGIEAGQAVVAVLAVLAITSEYGTGMIRTTFTAMPRRLGVLAAKAAVLTGLVLPAAIISVAGCLLAGREMLPGKGFTQARGFALLSLENGATLRAAGGSVLYLVLVGLLALGIATVVRDSAAATGTVLGLLYLAPLRVARRQPGLAAPDRTLRADDRGPNDPEHDWGPSAHRTVGRSGPSRNLGGGVDVGRRAAAALP
jgi:ABC-2 type transport system permease protein